MGITVKRLASSLSPSILIASNLFLFSPFTIYQGNIDEFTASLMTILMYFVYPFLLLVFILCAAGLLLPKKYNDKYVSILLVFGVLIWIQGNILVWKYGLLDGQSIDWTKDVWRGWVDGALWVTLFFVGFKLYKQISRIAGFTCIILISLQVMLFGYTSYQYPEIWKSKSEKYQEIPREIFEFSAKQNVIHIIFDAFQSDIFQEILDEDINYYNKALDGFTFFKETTSTFPYTYLSIPAIMSGENYRNDIPMHVFVNNTLNGKTIPNALHDNGYDVDLVHFLELYNTGRFSSSYCIEYYEYEGINQRLELSQASMMLDLILFRSAPHFLKKVIYNNQSWTIQPLLFQGDILQLRPFNHLDFLKYLTENIKVNKDKPVYKFIHLMSPHIPLVMNMDCNYAGKALPYTRENIRTQSRCTLNHLIETLDELRSVGIYDKSLIIVHGDHGNKIPLNNRNSEEELGENDFEKIMGVALPMMIIKPPLSHGALRTSNAQVMLTDIPATISSILDINEEFPGSSVLEVDPKQDRERRFYYHDWDQRSWRTPYFRRFIEHQIYGSVFERDSWRLGTATYDKDLMVDKIDFGSKGIGFYLADGWSTNEKSEDGTTFNWALGRSATLVLSLSKKKKVRLTANVKPYVSSKPQSVTIKVDGKMVGIWNLANRWEWQEHSVVIEPDMDRPDVSIMEFGFSHFHESEMGEKRPLAVLFESIILDEIKDKD